MSSDWPFVPLANLIRHKKGFAFKSSDYQPNGVPVIRVSNFTENSVSSAELKFVSSEVADENRDVALSLNDIVVATVGSWPNNPASVVGRTISVPLWANGSLMNQNSVILRAKTGHLVDQRFIYYQMKSARFSSHIISKAQGSANQASITLDAIFSFLLWWPELSTRKEICALLDALDDRITLLRETNATLEAIAQALFKSWFVDFDPVRAKAEGRQPEGMDATAAELFPDSFEESELGLVPKGWSHVSLKEVTAIFDSQRVPLSGQERDKRKGCYPYYGAAALMDWVDGYLFDGVYLLLGEDGSVANTDGYPMTQYVWGKIWVNNHAHVLQGKAGISTEHLMIALQQTNISPYITGAVQAKLSQSNMWRIPFLNPSEEVSIAFGEAIAPLFTSIRHNQEQTQTLTQLRDTLLPRLISGQLRLPEARQQLEDALA